MSFDVNIGRHQPAIKAASNMNNDGGSGGNTGYMMSGRRKKEKDNKALFDFNGEDDDFDTFLGKNPFKAPEKKPSFLKSLVEKFAK